MNPVVYFEIPVHELARAVAFYTALFGFDFTFQTLHGNEMAFFPFYKESHGITGALVKGEIYQPRLDGVLIYFSVSDIDAVLSRAQTLNAEILFPKTDTGGFGFVAEIKDSEGNRIGLSQK